MKDKLHLGALVIALVAGVGGRVAKCGKVARFADEGVAAARLTDPAADAARGADIFDVPADLATRAIVSPEEAARAAEEARLEALLHRAELGIEAAGQAIDATAGEPIATPDDLAPAYNEEGGGAEMNAIREEEPAVEPEPL